MSDRMEGSAAFSLQGLLQVEEERVADEQRRALERATAEAAARVERERLRREQVEEERAARIEHHRLEELRREEETARRDGQRQAEAERARVEAAVAARLSLLTQEQRNARELAESARAEDRRSARLVSAIAGVLATVAVLGSFAAHALVVVPDRERERAAARAALGDETARAERAESAARRERAALRSLGEELATLRRERDEARRERDEARRAGAGAPSRGARQPAGAAGPTAEAPCAPGAAHDPLDPCLR